VGILTPALNLTKSVVRQFLRDRGVRELVTYRQWTGQSFNQDQRCNVDVFSQTIEVPAIRLQAVDQVSDLPIGLALEAGRVVFMIDSADAPAAISLKDQIVDVSGAKFKIHSIRPIFGIVHAFVCEGVAS